MFAGAAVLFLLSGTSSAQTLQLYYPLDDGVAPGGTVLNLAGTGDGILTNGGTFIPSTAPSASGGMALRFTNDDNQFIATGLSSGALGFTNANPNGYAATAWVNMTANSGDSMVFGQQNGDPGGDGSYLHNGVRNGNYHQGHWASDITVGTVTFDAANGAGNWHHVIWEYENGNERIYVDGINVGQAVAPGAAHNPSNIKIGRSENGGGFDGVMDDVAVYSLGASERLYPNQVVYLRDGGSPLALPAGDPNSSFPVPNFIPVGLGGGGAGFATMTLAYTDGVLADLHSVSDAAAALMGGAVPLITENVPMVNHADTGTGGSPGGGYSITRDPKLRYPGDPDGDTEDIAYVYNGYVQIPTDGMYTFGVDGDDGQRLKLAGANFKVIGGSGVDSLFKGDTFGVEGDTGDAYSVASTFLTAGSHQIQVIGYERGGGAFNEAFAAVGETTNINDFRGIGHQASGQAATLGVTQAGWEVTTTLPGGNVLNTLADAIAEFSNEIPVISNHPSVNFNDPDSGGPGRLAGDVPFTTNTAADDNDFALLATATLVVPVDGTYRIGFQGDDGGEFGFLTPGVAFTALIENATGLSVIGAGVFGGDPAAAITCDCLTGNSSTVGEVTLAAGEYEVYAGFWERGGGAYFEVFSSGPGTGFTLLTAGGASITPDFDGLQWAAVPEPSSVMLSLFGVAGLFLVRRRRGV
ncbi:MAG: LamG-like jellyroll fold domain-containing protein [Pirellulales bacterium]